ncbi:transcription antitermination factor NusB [Propylenella binzhouense]|uniref:Transcription antitermination protein NusB n=1 Tax=Propylenella binzhouense TaxID=2555902 RepID=A0A964T1I0_9HYPH|nr:transcription antitermination factor NusB [Propylenella binzhouense]MYZ46706.1 transcription antitermination factor NusB [Propylenella binzhouense]
MTDAHPSGSMRPANQRGAARLAAVQALYQMDVGGTTLPAVVAEFEAHRLGRELEGEELRPADAGFFRGIVGGVVDMQRRIDPIIHGALPPDWPLKRIDFTLRAVLRCGVFELLERRDIPAKVVITEYVDVARAFFAAEEPGLVNAVLDHVARALRPDEFKSAAAR